MEDAIIEKINYEGNFITLDRFIPNLDWKEYLLFNKRTNKPYYWINSSFNYETPFKKQLILYMWQDINELKVNDNIVIMPLTNLGNYKKIHKIR